MAGEFQVSGDNADAPFTLRVHRGDGMALLAMDWKRGTPPHDFVGFAIEYMEPGGSPWGRSGTPQAARGGAAHHVGRSLAFTHATGQGHLITGTLVGLCEARVKAGSIFDKSAR